MKMGYGGIGKIEKCKQHIKVSAMTIFIKIKRKHVLRTEVS